MSSLDIEHFRTLLQDERQRVAAALENLHGENPGSLEDETGELSIGSAENHPGDVATETYDRELEYGLEENSEQVLSEIDAALARIDAGTYGTCSRCGKEIGAERLEAIPWTTLCIDDARKEEQR